MTDEEIGRELWGPQSGGSHRASETLLRLLMGAASTQEFWRIFNLGWNTCDDTWAHRGDLLNLMRRHGSGEPFLHGDAGALYRRLEDDVTLHRGCSADRVRGISWTTDPKIAATFARGHRGIPVPRAVIARAIVPKTAIFTVATERNESELIIDPRRLRQLVITPFDRGAA